MVRNIVLLSPQFPEWVMKFALALGKYNDVNVLGISDQPYDSLPEELKAALTEYYRVDTMDDYDSLVRAVGFYTHKYGKIDRFESLNEHWLETEARIREDFNIPGPRLDFIEGIRSKSRMKDFFKKAGVATIKGTVATTLKEALKFTKKVGYPVVVKPDSGSGAAFTYRVDNDERLAEIFAARPADSGPLAVEEFMDADTLTYDGIVDADGKILIDNTSRTDLLIMDVVNSGDNANYICLPDVPANIRAAGEAIVKAYNLRERFFHIELFDRRDGKGLVGLEINLRPPGGWLTDAMNVAHSTDVYDRWAAMIAGAPQPEQWPEKYYAAYASRKNFNNYAHSNDDCRQYLGDRLITYKPIEKILQAAMGDEAYLVRAKTNKEATEMINYIQERV